MADKLSRIVAIAISALLIVAVMRGCRSSCQGFRTLVALHLKVSKSLHFWNFAVEG